MSSSSSSFSSFPNNTKESCRLFNKYELYGWEPDPNLSDDDNFMDLVLIVTRSSQTTQGSMACIIVQQQPQPSSPAECCEEEEDKSTTKSFHHNRIISVATNGPLFTEKDSDIHAEIAALGQVCRRSCSSSSSSSNDTTVGGGSSTTTIITTQNATAYITMPPCKRCFAALVCAGITRIVSRLPAPKVIMEAAKRHHIDMVSTGNIKQQMSRINQLIYGNPDGPNKKTTTQKKRQGGVGGGDDESTSTTKENCIKRKQPKLDEKIRPI